MFNTDDMGTLQVPLERLLMFGLPPDVTPRGSDGIAKPPVTVEVFPPEIGNRIHPFIARRA